MVSVVRFDSGSFQKYFGDVRTNNMRPMQVWNTNHKQNKNNNNKYIKQQINKTLSDIVGWCVGDQPGACASHA
jgi:hypothetical protein